MYERIALCCPDIRGAVLSRGSCYKYLGGVVPSVQEDLRKRRGLAWAAFRSIRVVLQSGSLSDRLRG